MVMDEEALMAELIASGAPCRRCGHMKVAHKFIPKNKDRQMCMDATLTENGKYHVCECLEFAPKGNLEYLAWKAEKKGKKNVI